MQSDFKDKPDEIEKCFSIKPKNANNFICAITHGSYTSEKNLDILNSYERLEFLGDSVLKLVMSDILYKKYPNYNEGSLTKLRSILISDNMLAKLGKQIGLDKIIILGRQEEKCGGRKRNSIIACAFEAILGAYYLDGSYDEIYNKIKSLFDAEIENTNFNIDKINAKATLQEYTQKLNKELPIYKIIEEKGPEHDKIFIAEVSYMEQVLAKGEGKTKRDAQQDCAMKACKKLGIINE